MKRRVPIRIPSALKDELVKGAISKGMTENEYIDMILGEMIEGLYFSERAWKIHRYKNIGKTELSFFLNFCKRKQVHLVHMKFFHISE